MAEFVEKPFTEEIIQRIARQCAFGEMAKHPATYQISRNVNGGFLRKGEVGDWKNHLTPEMKEKIETKFVAKTRAHGLEFDS